MYLWWLPYLAAPAMLMATFAMLMVAALLVAQGRQKRAGKPKDSEGAGAAPVRPARRAWYTILDWGTVVGVVFSIVAVMLASMLLARRTIEDSRDGTISRMDEIYASVNSTIKVTNAKIEQNAVLLDQVNDNLVTVQVTANSVSTKLQQISDRVSYVEGFVDSMD